MKILVTGITGSLGQALAPLLLADGHQVIGLSRDELKQSEIPRHENQTLYLADVRDRDRLLEASRGCDLVFHLAAMKRIECCEEQPEEAASINIKGTENVLFCQRINKIPRVVMASTDKACEPITAYGYTKALSERLVLRNARNVVCRYGNVLASRGSVLSRFKKSIEEENVVQITDKRCTRFWWRLEDAAQFVLLSSQRELGGLCVPNLKAAPVTALANTLADILGKKAPRLNEIGFRCTEKLHEVMRTDDEGGRQESSNQALWFTKRELKELLSEVIAA